MEITVKVRRRLAKPDENYGGHSGLVDLYAGDRVYTWSSGEGVALSRANGPGKGSWIRYGEAADETDAAALRYVDEHLEQLEYEVGIRLRNNPKCKPLAR
jgi:hypothetical protein